jgi:hypothetical protein
MSRVDLTKEDAQSMSDEKLLINIGQEAKYLIDVTSRYRSIALDNLSVLNDEFKKRNLWRTLDNR